MPSLGCGTCRARKVRCDQAYPKCNRCIKAGRHCKGYGMQLSWPRRNDTRRAMIGPTPRLEGRQSEHRLVNTTFTDIKLHDVVSTSNKTYGVHMLGLPEVPFGSPDASPLEASGPLSLIKGPAVGPIARLNPADQRSFQYFMQTASYSITSFGHDAPRVRELLIQIALSDLSPSSTAVLKSALALASFHHENPLQATAQYKVAALRKLAESTQGRISVTDSACHIAAGMILSTLEIQQNSMKSSHWLWYACGAAKIVKTAGLDVDNLDHDTAALVGWVHYYNTLSRFSLRHWQPHVTLDPDDAADSFHPVVCGNGQPESLTGAPHEILYLLSEAFNAVTVPSDPRYETKAHRSHLEILDWKLRNLEKKAPDNNACADATHPAFDLVVELYRLSTLIYLRRASAGILPLDQKFTTWVGQAFELLEQLPACQWPFPLLVFGCEAESDRQRMIILEVMERTTEKMQYRNIATVKRVVETVWVQKDLYTEDMNYVRKLGVILSSTHKSVPAFI
ncbi:fungal-specific transcription factor domain-containing protein [Fusarium sp. MPI-SDFR-AT-0072]|nr:fungal-specific transcription factor domain-containing protein [Fusarium sp. MPI-SDFR-AT-0072]